MMQAKRPLVVFIGPSLPPEGLPEALQADVRPPAAQGDIAAVSLEAKDCVIALIDGVFQGAPAVRHKEILWAIDRGATIFGAASMGALRAAELSSFGMHGRGLIYRWFRRNALAPDDAVAVLHTPEELGAVAITDSLVDLRIRFKQSRKEGQITACQESALVTAAFQLHYTERHLKAVLATARDNGANITISDLAKPDCTQKQLDAQLLLDELTDRQKSGLWPLPTPGAAFVPTDAFLQDLADAGFSLDSFSGA
ncbi:TfuA-like protein [Roseibium porphyridii]|uniref:TfuA-like protein n=1 Tax=Roseibium porphyridii TaxID=2866279 RepID=A0ABY8F3W0_9HYPH|nr:TfuA-like protein [Roseibium sp. KMA01]WFE89901.1 TfuA-like protein [Roseibium sp. KMA01]